MNQNLKVLDLFSGIGRFSLGLERAGMETVAFCEIDPYCQKILSQHWPHVSVAKDINKMEYDENTLFSAGTPVYKGIIDVVCGGFPCQPFSINGRKLGEKDHRDLWPQMFRLIQQTQPTWVIGENVAHFANMAFARAKSDLESQGYTVQPFIIPACSVGAPQARPNMDYCLRQQQATIGADERQTQPEKMRAKAACPTC